MPTGPGLSREDTDVKNTDAGRAIWSLQTGGKYTVNKQLNMKKGLQGEDREPWDTKRHLEVPLPNFTRDAFA